MNFDHKKNLDLHESEWAKDGKKQPVLEVPGIISVISYGLAAAILIPIGWWLKSQHLFGLGDWIVSLFH